MRAILRIGVLVAVAALILGACDVARLVPPPVVAFDHDGYALTCDGVARDTCITRADAVTTLILGHNGTIEPTSVRIRPDDRFQWCWQRRPEAAVVALVTGRRGSGCLTRLGWLQRS